MNGSVFLDTNILVYAIESAGPDPQKTAAALAIARRTDICLSTQVLGEFYRAVTSSRRAARLTVPDDFGPQGHRFPPGPVFVVPRMICIERQLQDRAHVPPLSGIHVCSCLADIPKAMRHWLRSVPKVRNNHRLRNPRGASAIVHSLQRAF
jgi:predicted nucleic acid-binding protein